MAYYPASLLMPDVAQTQNGILDSYSPSSVLSKLGQPVMYVVRHANVKLDSAGKIRGLENPELDDKGKKQAAKTAAFFGDVAISLVVTDDLARTQQTALAIVEEKGVPLEIDIRLRSWDLGDLEGEDIDAHDEEIKEFKQNPSTVPVAGQSWGDFTQQITDSFREYLRKSMDGLPVVYVTHGSAIQVIFEMLGDDVGEGYHEIPLEPSGVCAILLTRDGFWPQIVMGEKPSQDE